MRKNLWKSKNFTICFTSFYISQIKTTALSLSIQAFYFDIVSILADIVKIGNNMTGHKFGMPAFP